MFGVNAISANNSKQRSFYWPTTKFLISEQKHTPKSRRRAKSCEHIHATTPNSKRRVNHDLGKSLESMKMSNKHDLRANERSPHIRRAGGQSLRIRTADSRSKSFVQDSSRNHLHAGSFNSNIYHSNSKSSAHITTCSHGTRKRPPKLSSDSRTSSTDSDQSDTSLEASSSRSKERKPRSSTLPLVIYTTVCESDAESSSNCGYRQQNKQETLAASLRTSVENTTTSTLKTEYQHSPKTLRARKRLNKYIDKVKNIF